MTERSVDWSRASRLGLTGLRRRLLVVAAAGLLYVLLLEASVSGGLTGRHWWGLAAEPGPSGQRAIVWLEPNGLAWSVGLRVGDRLLSAAGRPIGTATNDSPVSDREINIAHELLAATDGGVILRAVRPLQPANLGRDLPLSATAISVCFALTGAAVYVRATTRREARALTVACWLAAVTLVSVPAGVLGHPWAVRLSFVGAVLVPTAFACLFLVFPVDRTRRDRQARLLLAGLVALPAAALLAYAVSLLWDLETFGWARRLSLANMVVGYGAGLILLLASYLGEPSARARQRLRIAVSGTIAGVLPFLLLTVLPMALASVQQVPLNTIGYLVPAEITVLGTVLIPLSFGYAVLRHELIAADVVIRRGVVYLGAVLAITSCYLFAIAAFQVLYRLATGRQDVITTVVATLLVALAADPLRHWIESYVERIFFGDVYAFRQLLDSAGPRLDTVRRPDELAPLILETVAAALPTSRIVLLVASREPSRPAAGRSAAPLRLRLLWDQSGPRTGEVVLADLDAASREAARGPLSGRGARSVVLRHSLAVRLPSPAEALPAGVERRADGPAPGPEPAEPERLEVRVLTPLRAGGQLVAVLALGERRDGEPYSGADLEFLDTASERYAVALDNALLHETLRRQADTDALTGLDNHRSLLEQLEAQVALARQSGQLRAALRGPELAVLMMDVNSFKFVNDTYGHQTGDRVLVTISHALRAVCRKGDIFGRYGGDEFVVILPGTGREGAHRVAARINAAAQQMVLHVRGGPPMSLSVTTGVAVLPEDGETPTQLIAAADVAMYQAKRSTARDARTLPSVADVPPGPLRGMLLALHEKDGFVAAHSERVAHWAVRLAVALGLAEREQEVLRLAGLLHDVGKLGTPERLLNKAEPLTAEDRQVVEQHVELGLRLIRDVPYEDEVVEVVACHHERWDGLGYPRGLSGEDIPLLGRILAVADVYAAMTTDRPYRPRLTPAEASARLAREAGSQLDPRLVAALLDVVPAAGAAGSAEVLFAPGDELAAPAPGGAGGAQPS